MAVLPLLAVAPAYADVLQVGNAGVQWVTGSAAQNPIEANLPQDRQPITTPDASLAVDLEATGGLGDVSLTRPLTQAGPVRWRARVAQLAAKYDISPALLEAVVWQESRWNEAARSHAGARGLTQLMPGTARYLGVDPDDPSANLEGGARYLRMQLDTFDGDIEKALAAYNAGPRRVKQAGGVPNIAETRAYVAAIMGRLSEPVRR